MSEKYSNFVSTIDLDARKEENKKARQIILEQAKKKYEREEAKREKAKMSGEGTWMLDSITQRIQNDSKKLKKAKKKKSRKEKKKKRHSSSSTSEEDEDLDNNWVEVSRAEIVDNQQIKGPKIQRESWMEAPLDFLPTTSRQDLRDIVKKQKDEANREAERLLQPGQHVRELNPHWRDGGTGLPSSDKQNEPDKKSESSSSSHRSTSGDGGLAWLRQAYIRCKQQAVDEGRSLEEVTAERWGSLEKLESMLAEAERKHKNQHNGSRAQDLSTDRDHKRHDRHRERSPPRSGNDPGSCDRRDKNRDHRDDRSRPRFHRPGSDEEDHREMSSGHSRKPSDDSRDSKGDKSTPASRFRPPKSDSEEDSDSSRKPPPADRQRKGAEEDSHRGERRWKKSPVHVPRWKKSVHREENDKEIMDEKEGDVYRGKDRHESREKDRHKYREKDRHESREEDRHEYREKDRHESKEKGRQDSREKDRHISKSKENRQQDKNNREMSRRKYSSSSSSGSSSDSDDQKEAPDKVAEQEVAVQVATEEELNDMAAKILRAEIMGNDSFALELKDKLEKARKLREASKAQGGDGIKDFSHARKEGRNGKKSERRGEDNEETDNVVVLSRTSKRGLVRPVVGSSDPWGAGSGRKRKRNVQTHDIAGQRTIYFDDDDKLDLKTMVEQEKSGTAEDQNSMFARLAGKSNDRDLDVDDMFVSKAARQQDAEKAAEKDRASAIFDHKKMSSAIEKCHRCLQKVPKHLIIAIGAKSYLCLPHHRSLTEGHCLIVPMQHVLSGTSMDEDVWKEMQMFRQSLVQMFRQQDQDVVFMETVMHLKHFPHTALDCVPLDREQGDLAPIYFKKAIQDAGPEWSDNKKLHSLKGKDVRRVIPKGFPYFCVDFGLEGGFATVIEDEIKFPAYFGREIVGGMIDAEPMLWRHPHKQSFEDQRQKVLKFEQMWKPFDWTQNLTSAD